MSRSTGTKLLAQFVANLVESKAAAVRVTPSRLPKNTRATLSNWIDKYNLPTSRSNERFIDVYKVTLTIDPPIGEGGDEHRQDYFIADYSGNLGEDYRAIAVIMGGRLIGHSIEVSS